LTPAFVGCLLAAPDGLHISILTLDPISRRHASSLAENLIDNVRIEYINAQTGSPQTAAGGGTSFNKKLFVGSLSEYFAFQKSLIVHEHWIPIRRDYPTPRHHSYDDDFKRLALHIDSLVDVRDSLGYWFPAQVMDVASLPTRGAESTERGDILLHSMIGFSERWVDVIASRIEPYRFAEFRQFSFSAAKKKQIHQIDLPHYHLNQWVDIYAHKKWRRGKITRLDRAQCQVTYVVLTSESAYVPGPTVVVSDPTGSFHQFWFPFGSDEIHPLPGAVMRTGDLATNADVSSIAIDQGNTSKLIESAEFLAFCIAHPEVKAVIDTIAPEYLALRERALKVLFKACLCPEAELPIIQTQVSSTEVMFALRQWLMRNDTLTEADADVMVRKEIRSDCKIGENVIKMMVTKLLDTARALAQWIQKSPRPRDSFTFVHMPNGHIVLMETGLFAAAWRRCAGCAKAGIRRCSGCGLVWHCSKACQAAHGGQKSTVASADAKMASFRPCTYLTCRGPAVDRSVFRAAQIVLGEGFRPIERVSDFSDPSAFAMDSMPDQSSRAAVYEAALRDLAKPLAASVKPDVETAASGSTSK
jgi:hypothetical protein